MVDEEFERQLRLAAIRWVDDRDPDRSHLFTYAELASFTFEGRRVPLMDRGKGIWKPAILRAALSIRTTYPRPHEPPPYEDQIGPDGLFRYKYRGTDPRLPDNVALRHAMNLEFPLIWFRGVSAGNYFADRPVWLLREEPDHCQFVLWWEASSRPSISQLIGADAERQYVERTIKARLHQPLFRAQVLAAYENHCAVCNLRHPSLLDAAHIIPDGRDGGEPIVVNGLSLCKIHHAAYDQNLIGVTPDLVVKLRNDLREETDGPMLRHGLQEMDGQRLLFVPHRARSRPDPDRLAVRFDEFLRVAG